MREIGSAPESGSSDRGIAWNALVALATGALLGALVGLPYGRSVQFSTPLRVTLQSLAVVFSFASLSLNGAKMTLDLQSLPHHVSERRVGGWKERARRLLGNLDGARNVFQSDLRTQLGASHSS
jgi:hypothetical protein